MPDNRRKKKAQVQPKQPYEISPQTHTKDSTDSARHSMGKNSPFRISMIFTSIAKTTVGMFLAMSLMGAILVLLDGRIGFDKTLLAIVMVLLGFAIIAFFRYNEFGLTIVLTALYILLYILLRIQGVNTLDFYNEEELRYISGLY